MDEHRQLVETTRRQEGPKVVALSPQTPNLQKCKGSYLIRCEQLAREYSSETFFTLDVGFGRGPNPRVLAGALDLSVFDGTMLLVLEHDRHRLDEFAVDNAAGSGGDTDDSDESNDDEDNEDRKVDEDEEDEEDYEDDESDDNEEDDEGDDGNYSRSARKRKTAPVPSSNPPRKKAKSADRHFSVLLRGRESGTGEIMPDSQAGFLEFSDDLFAHFTGKIDMSYLGKAVKIEGFKVASRAKDRLSHGRTSQRLHEYARVARWR